MLPLANRLKHYKDFQTVYQQGGRFTGTHLIIRTLKAKNQEHPSRIGITISQKVSKKAVIRNRIKRQIRAATREILPRIAPNWRIVIIVRPSAVGCNYDNFLRELEKLFMKAGIINGH